VGIAVEHFVPNTIDKSHEFQPINLKIDKPAIILQQRIIQQCTDIKTFQSAKAAKNQSNPILTK
jgi:uncharacterized membrane protein